MKVAFCSNDGTCVDEHFGRSNNIYIYDVNKSDYTFLEKRSVTPIDGSVEHKNITELKVESIKDCTLLYVNEVGGPAAAVIIKNKIHPIKVDAKRNIIDVLNKLKEMLNNNPPMWLVRANLNKEK